MPIIQTSNLRKQFGDLVAVSDTSFHVDEGENFGLLGRNGAGKSTLIRMLTTLIVPTAGTASVAGYDILGDPDGVRKSIGVVPQAMTSDMELTAEENLDFYAKLHGVRRLDRLKVIDELLSWVDLLDWRNKMVGTFSGGMRRRLEIARSLVQRPKILFLDEPTAGLDPASRLAMWEMLGRLKSETDLTVFLTTHYMEEADQLCDRIAIFDRGKIVALDTPANLKAVVPGTETVEARFTSPPADWPDVIAQLPEVIDLQVLNEVYVVSSEDRTLTVTALLDAAHRHGVEISSFSIRGKTLEDVFIHYTGRDNRDEDGRKQRLDVSYLYEKGAR